MSDPVDWSRIRRVVEAALERPPAERSSYVDRVCSGDDALRGQVERMLASIDQGSAADRETQALDAPPVAEATDPLIGKTLLHYKVTAKIGQGGMGEVYRAWDAKLDREVAIKVLPRAFAEDARRLKRFEREARLLAAVNHPNIATIHGVEEAAGIRFLVLELVEGEALDERIARGPVPPEEAAPLFRQIVDALEAAHEAGIIHRDLKPANVMITTKGHVKVLDFGLAKVLDPLPSGEETPLDTRMPGAGETRAGTIVGTLSYMSPEQAGGKPLDRRTDFWSFGCTLFEALSGRSPFYRTSMFETIAAIMERDPDWSELPPATPPAMRRLLERCLKKDPDERIDEAEEIRAALLPAGGERSRLRLAAAAVLLVLAVALATWWVASRRPAEVPADGETDGVPTVAVTAPVNLSGRPELDWMREGLARLVRDRLAESRHVAVVSKSRWDAIARTAGEGADPGRIAADAGIDYLVTGEILSAPDGLMWTTRVSDPGRGVDLAARRFEGLSEETLLESSNRVSMLAKQAMKIPHTETVDVFAADFSAGHPAAYEAYLSGLQFFEDFDFVAAERAFRSALELAPDYHIARYRLAYLLFIAGRTDEARETIAQIPDDAPLSRRERLYVDGARALFEWDWESARQAYETLLDEYPYEIEARQFLAEVHASAYDDEAALEQLRIIAEQEPEKETVWLSLAETRLRVERFEAAREALERFRELAPEDPAGYDLWGQLYRATGRLDEAAEAYRHVLELDADFAPAILGLALVSALAGRDDRAEELWRSTIGDVEMPPGYRIDAAFDLSAWLRAQGRFAASLEPLARLEAEIEAEEARRGLALAARAWSRLELGELDAAYRLASEAVASSPPGVPPTRYLFTRGLVELARGQSIAVRETAETIRSHALPPDDPDRTEELAATYLEAMLSLAEGDPASAIDTLESTAELDGYRYRRYGLGYARALLAAGRFAEAAELAAREAADRDYVEPRLDLELDRVRAGLLEAEARAALGGDGPARELAKAFLDRWARAPGDLPDVERARRIVESR